MSDLIPRDVPFTLSCFECDCDSPDSHEDALQQGWTMIRHYPEGASENFLGLCPACRHAQEQKQQAGTDDLQRSLTRPRYECDCCGACCQGHLIVQAEWLDVVREPRLIQADRHYVNHSPTDALKLLEEPGRAVTLACGSACRVLDEDKRCTIYPTRPNDCVGMQAGDEQCQQARQAAGLPPLEPLPDPAQQTPFDEIPNSPDPDSKGGDPP